MISHRLANSDIRRLVAARQTVSPENWVAVDRYLNERFARGNQKGYEAWLTLPRVAMAEGGEALANGLKDYQAWVDKHLALHQQISMLANIVLNECELETVPVSVPLGNLTHWLSLAAAEEGLSVDAFVTAKLAWHANGKRDAALKKLISG